MAKSDTVKLVTEAKDRTGEPITGIKVDGRELTAHRPKDAALVFVAMTAQTDDGIENLREVTRFVDACLVKEDRDWIASRLRDPDDDYDFTDLSALFRALIEKVSGNPTESQDD